MGHIFSSILVIAAFLVVVRTEPVTWYSPTDGQAYHPGDTLVAQWHTEYIMSDISFRLCTEDGVEADGIGNDECGLPIAPQVFANNETYEAYM